MGYLALSEVIEHGHGVVEEVYHDGTIIWKKNGLIHRIGGPALIRSDGELQWMEDGKPHRLDGPAIIYPNGSENWFIKGGCLQGEDLKRYKEKYNLNKELNKDLSKNNELDKSKKPKL